MLVKFFHHGMGTSDSAMAYLLSEAPLRYLAGPRDGKGVIRNPAPAVVKGDPEITRRLINQLQTKKHGYVSGVLSFKELISPGIEQQIIDRFEASAFAGLKAGQFDCLWIRHSHNARSELHFLVPRCELTTGKALNIRPPGKASEDLYDSFRILINREFQLEDPDPQVANLRLEELLELRERLGRLTSARATYNQERYRSPSPDLTAEITVEMHEDRTRSADGSIAEAGTGACRTESTERDALERIGRACRALTAANANIELTSELLGGTAQGLRETAAQALGALPHQKVGQQILDKYGVPAANSLTNETRFQEIEALEPRRERSL